MRLLGSPLFRSYVFNYAKGKALPALLLERRDALAGFERLLRAPIMPSQILDRVAQEDL